MHWSLDYPWPLLPVAHSKSHISSNSIADAHNPSHRHVDWKAIGDIHLPRYMHTHTLENTCKTVQKRLQQCTFTLNPNSLFVWNPLVVARPRAVTAHQSSVGRGRADYLLHVTACVCSFREALGPREACEPPLPPPPLLLLPTPERGAPDPDSDLLLPSCRATSKHMHISYKHKSTHRLFLSFTILAPLTFLHNFPQSSFNQTHSSKQNFSVVQEVILGR